MRNDILLKQRALRVVEQLRGRIIDPGLCSRHRRRPQDFSRECRLSFPVLMMLLLQKSLQSPQARLHALGRALAPGAESSSLSAGAVTHAWVKLCASAFVERTRWCVLPAVNVPENQEMVE